MDPSPFTRDEFEPPRPRLLRRTWIAFGAVLVAAVCVRMINQYRLKQIENDVGQSEQAVQRLEIQGEERRAVLKELREHGTIKIQYHAEGRSFESVRWLTYENYNGPADLEPVTKLANLKRFAMNADGEIDVSRLSECQKLRRVTVVANRIRGLDQLTAAERLYIVSKAPFTDFEPLSGLTNLRTLKIVNASATQVEDVSMLANLSELEELEFVNTSVPAAQLSHLEESLPHCKFGQGEFDRLSDLDYYSGWFMHDAISGW